LLKSYFAILSITTWNHHSKPSVCKLSLFRVVIDGGWIHALVMSSLKAVCCSMRTHAALCNLHVKELNLTLLQIRSVSFFFSVPNLLLIKMVDLGSSNLPPLYHRQRK
jgi:hypothetical protein